MASFKPCEPLSPYRELYRFLSQAHISLRNIKRIEVLACHADPRIRSLATLVREIAQVKPHKRRRLAFITSHHWDLLVRMVGELDEDFWDSMEMDYDDRAEWLWEKVEAARAEAGFRKFGAGPCPCGSERAYWRCCAEQDEETAFQVQAEAQEREYDLHPETIPWWHPDSGVDYLTRSAYEMYYVDPDHPLAQTPPEWQDIEVPSPKPRKKHQRKKKKSSKR